MNQRTPLFESHQKAHAKIVPFVGWDMPLHYGSQVEEHHAVRLDAGMFDVSHMARVDLRGGGVRPFLRRLLANNVDKLKSPGKALYSCMLNDDGGVMDDLIVYFMRDDWFRLVVNAATRDKDMAWIKEHSQHYSDVEVVPRPDLAMIAVQGPNAREKTCAVLGESMGRAAMALEPFSAVEQNDYFVARTGYTGEDGFEVMVPNARAAAVWNRLARSGVTPCGLGARDTLRLEAGMNLYGNDMDESTTPLESGLGWTVAWKPEDRDFVGRAPLERQRSQGLERKLLGLVLVDKGVLRAHQVVRCANDASGVVTSGTFSPTLQRAIALARLPASVNAGDSCEVEVRAKQLPVRVVDYPFVRHGKSCLPEI